MSRNDISIQTLSLIDPVEFAKSSRYIQNGLTYISNNDAVHTRDDAGNIILKENSDTNQLLIIEPTVKRVATRSVIKVVDTTFNYFKFPVSVRSTETLPDLDLDFTIETNNDIIYARYKPSENRFIAESIVPSGILMDEVVEGNIQTKTNTYSITKEVKNSGADIRIRVKIAHSFSPTIPAPSGVAQPYIGTCYFTIIRNGPDYQLNRYFRPIQTNNPVPEVYANGRLVDGEFVFGAIGFEVNELLTRSLDPPATQNLFIDEIIRNSEFEIGDNFSIGAFAGQANQHTIIAEQTYMVVTDASKNVDEWNQEV
jgi:hypothetical protein